MCKIASFFKMGIPTELSSLPPLSGIAQVLEGWALGFRGLAEPEFRRACLPMCFNSKFFQLKESNLDCQGH